MLHIYECCYQCISICRASKKWSLYSECWTNSFVISKIRKQQFTALNTATTLKKKKEKKEKKKEKGHVNETSNKNNHIRHPAPATSALVMTAAHPNTQQKQKPECCFQTSHIEGGTRIGCSGYNSISFMYWMFAWQLSPIIKNGRVEKFYWPILTMVDTRKCVTMASKLKFQLLKLYAAAAKFKLARAQSSNSKKSTGSFPLIQNLTKR